MSVFLKIFYLQENLLKNTFENYKKTKITKA